MTIRGEMGRPATQRLTLLCLTLLVVGGLERASSQIPGPSLPERWSKALEQLCSLGFPDPKGLPYHEIELVTSEFYQRYAYRMSTGKPVRLVTRGWLLPKREGQASAIAWNGYVYPVEKVGPVVSLEDDVSAMKKEAIHRNPPLAEFETLDPKVLSKLRVALLLQSGEVDLAQSLLDYHGLDPYFQLVIDWMHAGVEAMLHAFHRGEDTRAKRLASQLIACQKPIQDELDRRGIKPRFSSDPKWTDVLEVAKKVRNGEYPPFGSDLKLEGASIETLIAQLPNIQVYQTKDSDYDKYLPLSDSPIYQALRAKGEEALPMLLKCLRNDHRLTRSLYNRDILPVHVVAKALIDDILGVQAVSVMSLSYRHYQASRVNRIDEAIAIEQYLNTPPNQRRVPLVTHIPFQMEPNAFNWPDIPGLAPRRWKQPPLLVPPGLKNMALGKPVTCSHPNGIVIGEISMATDGETSQHYEAFVETGPELQWIQIDLEEEVELHAVWLWHTMSYWVFNDVVIQVSNDSTFSNDSIRTLFNNDRDNSSGLGKGEDPPYMETNRGWVIDAKQVKARYLRCYCAGNNMNSMNRYIEVEAWGQPVTNGKS